MASDQERQEQRQTLQKRVALKEDGYYANCAMVEMTPFDLSILFGKVRPVTDTNGQGSLVEMYDRQIYLSHLHVRGPGAESRRVESARQAIQDPRVDHGRDCGKRGGQIVILRKTTLSAEIRQVQILFESLGDSLWQLNDFT